VMWIRALRRDLGDGWAASVGRIGGAARLERDGGPAAGLPRQKPKALTRLPARFALCQLLAVGRGADFER
jgi:hypothetical protein